MMDLNHCIILYKIFYLRGKILCVSFYYKLKKFKDSRILKFKIWAASPQGNEPQSSLIRVFVSIGSHVQEQHTTLGVETLYNKTIE